MIIVNKYNKFMFKFRSKITIKLLGYFFLNPQKSHYINELASILNLDIGNLFRKLRELEQEGILYSEMRGNQKYYGLNKDYSLLKEVKKAYNSKNGLPNLLERKLNKLKNLEEAYLFGSYAQDNLQQESDIDILLIGNHSSLEAKRLILPLQKDIGREINIIDMSLKELEARKRKKDEFIQNIFSHKFIKIY